MTEKAFTPATESINVFPSEISSPTWKNLDALSSQDLSEQSLFQEFNRGNSAYIETFSNDASVGTQSSNSDSGTTNQTNGDQSLDTTGTQPDTPNTESQAVETPEAQTETVGTDADASEVPSDTGVEEVPASDPVAEPISDTVSEPTGTVELPNESTPVSQINFEDVSLFASGYATIFKRALGDFAFAEAVTTTPIISDDATVESFDQEVSGDLSADPASSVDDTQPSSLEGSTNLGVSGETSDADIVDSEVESDTDSTTSMNASAPYVITLRDFGIPKLESGQFIDNLQLRLSLAGQYAVDDSGKLPSLSVEYSFGEFKRDAGSILIDTEISNALNGGYYLIPLPSITDPALLSDLTITISFIGDVARLESLYVDAAWLQVGTVTFDRELLKERFAPSEMLKHLEGPKIMELLSDRLDFVQDDLPQFNLRYTSQRNFLVQAFRSLLGRDLAAVDSITFVHNGGEPVGITPEVTVTPEGLISVVFTEADKEKMKPGVYSIELEINEGGLVTTDSFDFQWGLLSINTNKTEYSKNDVVNISMGALSPNGNTLCDADLNLYISDPNGFISSPEALPSGQCSGNNVIDVPDYSAQFIADGPGTYEIYLERVDESGTVISHTTSTFIVNDNQQISIERNGPTRIYPPSPYAMKLTVKAEAHPFVGELIERVPNNFKIVSTDAVVRPGVEYTELIWSVSLAVGESKTVSYEFDAPDLSPYLYELGPAQLVSNEPWSAVEAIPQPDVETTFPESATEVVPPTEPEAIPPVIEEPSVVAEPTPTEPVAPEVPEAVPTTPENAPTETPVMPDTIPTEALPTSNVDPLPEPAPAPNPVSENILLNEMSYAPLFRQATGDFLFAQAEVIDSLVPQTMNSTPTGEETALMTTVESSASLDQGTMTSPEPAVVDPVATSTNVVFIEHRTWQIASDATGNMILFWDNATAIPAGWTCLSCGSGAFFQNFAQGNSTYNTTGGATTHTPTATATVTPSALATIGNGGGATTAVVGHTHTYAPTIGSASNLPLYRQLRVIEYTDGAGEPASIPAGAIGVFDVASSSLPNGWTRYAAQDGYYIRGEDVPGTTGGSNTHSHTLTGNTGNAAGGTTGGGGGTNGATAAHNHAINTTTGTMNNEPPYLNVLLGKSSATATPPNNLIAMWTDTVPTGWTDVSSGVSDPFNGRFLKASTSYGVASGTSAHQHANVTGITSGGPSATVSDAAGVLGASNVHTHQVSVGNFNSTSHLPPYLTVIFGKRANFNPFYTQNSYRWYVNVSTSTTPTDVWPSGATNLPEGDAITATSSPVKQGEVIRLRMNVSVSNVDSPVGSTFKLQYGVPTSTCSGVASWTDVGTTTSSAIWRGYDNGSLSDHATLSSTTLSGSVVKETYEENGYATATPNVIASSSVGEWDYVIQNNGAAAATSYCFRMVKGDSSAFYAYTNYPRLITDQAPYTPTQVSPFDNEKNATTTPTFSFVGTDLESDSLQFEFTIDDNFDFSSPATTTYSSNYPGDTGWTASTSASGATTTYTIRSANALVNGTTYWWRVRSRDPVGSNEWSSYSSVQSVTIDTSLTEREWYQTLGLQFGEGTRTRVSTTTGAVTLTGGTTVVPVLGTASTSNTAVPGNTLTLTKPSGVAVGDLLLIIVGNDNATANAQWDNTTNKPSGFTLINEAGNATPDAHVAAFYRIADGTESNSTTTTAQASANYFGFYTYVTGVDTTNPINVTGADYIINNLLSHPITSVTTTASNTLAFYVLAGDGGDTYPFSVSGTGWVQQNQIQAGTLATNAAGTWGTRTMTSPGATGAATVLMSANDGASGFQFAINPAPTTTGSIMSPEVDFDWVSGQTDWGAITWHTTEPTGSNTLLQVYYSSTTACDTRVPDSALAGNSTGYDVSQSGFFISSLSTTTYNRLCLKMNFDQGTSSTSPSLDDWSVSWVVPNQVPYTPNLAETPAFPYEKSTTTRPTLGGFASTDYENNALEYEVIIDDDYDLSSPATTTYSYNYPGDAGWSAATFTAGATTTYTVQASNALTSGTTYWWAVRARDPGGTNTWSATSTVRSITVSNAVTVPEWYQTTEDQFNLDTLSNATTTPGGVEIASLSTASGSVTIQSAWAQQYANGAYPAGVVNANYTITAGTNRVLVVAIATTRSVAGTSTASVTYGGQALTMATGDGTNATNVNHTYLFYLNDAGISATSSNSLNVTVTGGTSYYTYVYAAVFAGVDQTSIYTDAQNYFSGATFDASVGPFASGLTVGQGDQAIEIVNLARSAVGNAVRTVSTWSNASWPNPSTVAATQVPTANWGVGLHINNRNSTTSATESSQHTASSANTQDSMSGMSLKAAVPTTVATVMSPEIKHSWVPNQSTWGEVSWNTTEPANTSSLVHVYYTSTTTCDVIVPDASLPGNSTGFSVSSSPLDISALSTTTYSRLCLKADLESTGVSSPSLNDWTVTWVRTPHFTEKDFRWYATVDDLTPTDAWPVGGTDLLENEAISSEYAIVAGADLRLRMSLSGTSTTATAGSVSFKLQYAPGDTCSADLTWYDVGDTASTTALWRGFNNPSIADATAIPTLLLASSTVKETYEEHNDTLANPNAINVGAVAEWDWTLKNNAAVDGTTYCFRMVYTDGTALYDYTNYPSLITNNSPNAPTLYVPFDNEKLASTSPQFEFASVDSDGNEIDYQIQIDDNVDFSSTVIDTNSITNLTDFLNLVDRNDKSPFNNTERMRYTIPSALATSTYWWRVRAIDVDGSNNYGDWSTSRSFTVNTSVAISTWFQTTEQQFDTDTLVGTDATAGNLVAFASGSTTGTTTSSEIDFSWATVGNAWGQFAFTETGAANDILYHLEYYSDGAWDTIPDSALSGNVAGFDTSPVDLLDLDTSVYSIIRIRANYRSGSPTLLDWTISWGERVSVATHISPFDNEKFATTSPTFTFYTTDPQNDDLEYEISWSTSSAFTVGSTTRNSSTSPGFLNLTHGSNLNPFYSGDSISYTIQPSEALVASTTYWWRVRAKDPYDSNSFSFWSNPWSFTTATTGESIGVSTWFQTTGEQFDTGTLTGLTTATGSVGVGGGIVVESGWTSNTIVPGNSLTLTKPTGVAVGDLLLILLGNDDATANAQWDNTTNKPSGFTLINEAGNATPDAHVAAFYRVADGSEGTTINVPSRASANYWGYYIRITGVDTSSPINVTGTDYAVNNLLSHPVTSVTTTASNTLAFYLLGGDGGDTYPFSVSGTGWTERAEIQAGTLATNAAGTWGTRTMSSPGATGAATVLMSANDGASGFQFALNPAPVASGQMISPAVDFNDGTGPTWGSLSWSDTELGGSTILYHLEYQDGIGDWVIIPDSALSGNSTGFGTSPVSLSSLDTTTYNVIRAVADFDCNGASCPTLNDWTITWARGFTVSGTAFEYDGVSSTTSGTVAIAVDGVIQTGKTGTISNGTWSIDNVTFFSGDIITVFVNGAADADEAVAVTAYDGTPDVTGMRLQKRHLTIGSGDHPTLTNTDLAIYDTTNDEDLFFNVDAGNDLTLCGDVSCDDAGLVILASSTYSPGSGADVTTHDFRNDGTFTAGSNNIRVSGSWDNNATTTMTGSTVIMTATSTSETIDSTGAISAGFNNLTLGETSGTATWTLQSALDVNGSLSLSYGTLARGVLDISIDGNLTTGASGFWTGIGTTTFDGTNPSTWTDNNATKQNIGRVLVDGTSKTLVLGSNVTMQSLSIGADDTFDLSITGYTASVYRNWINNNTFTARTGSVNFIATTTGFIITAGGDAFYNINFTGVGGSWSFSEADLSVTNDFTIATGTVTMPTGTTTLSGSFTSAGGTFAHNNALIYFNSSAAETITASGTAFTNAFYDLRFGGSGSWSFVGANATTSNNLFITQGTVTMPSGIMAVGGNFVNSGGTFAHNSGTIQFTSAGVQTIDTNASFYNLFFTGTGLWSFVDSSVTLINNLTIATGTVTFPSNTFTIGGSLTNTGTIAHNNGTVLMNATASGRTVNLGSSSLYNMTMNGVGGAWTITGNATTSNNFTLATSSSFTLQSGLTLSVGGTFTNGLGGASTTWTGSILSLEAGAYSINTKSNVGDAYATLRVKANADIQMWNSTSTVYDVNSAGSLYSEDHNGVDGDLYIFGSYERMSGTEYWSYSTDFDGTALGGSSRQVDVRFASGSSALFGTSTLNLTGTTAATTTIASQAGSTYTVSVVNGTTTASYYDFSDLGNNGLILSGTTKITSLGDGRFVPGILGGTGITVSSTTIDSNPGLQIYRVNFSTTTTIAASNVSQTDGTPASYWWFRSTTGNISGEAFDNDTGDPGSIRWDDSSLAITVSGTVYRDDGVTLMGTSTCDGVTPNVRIVVDSGTAYTGSCSVASSSYSISGIGISGDVVLTTYLNTNGGESGTVITKTPTTDITHHNIYANRIITKHEDVLPLTIADMAKYDGSDDSDIKFTAATGTTDTLIVNAGNELHIASSTTFAPGGTVTIEGNASGTTQDGSLHIDDNATFTGAGTTTYSIGGSITMDTGGTFTPASSTVVMTATTTGKTITAVAGQQISFNNLQFTGVNGGWNINSDIRALGNIVVSTGTVTGTNNITLPYGSFSGNGTVSLGSGTTTIEQTNTLGGTTPWTFANLVLGNGSVVGTTTPGSSATTTILEKLTISTGHYLNAGNSVWDLRGTGTVFVENGTFLEGTSKVQYSGASGSNVLSTNYYDLALNALGGSPTYTGTGLGIVVLRDLTIGGQGTTTANFTTNDPALDVNGNVTIAPNSTLISSNSGSFTVGGSWDNNGTFTSSGGTVTFDSAGTKTIAAGNSTFSSVVVSGAGDFTMSEHATATSAFTITTANNFTLGSGVSLAVGGTFTNSLGGANTVWTGSTLYLYGNGNYQINGTTTSDQYGTLTVAGNTHIRMWNSSASTTSIDSTGSLYSQDHGAVDGSLYIYGSYPKTSGTDYWSYATDFDGRSLSGGSERKVNVYLASGASVTYTGGGLHVLGANSASTTIQNQGSGTYSFRIGGTASTSMSYYEVRDTDASGITFSGTPNVVTLSYGDYRVVTASGTAITVGGTVINQNPARTFTNNIFATTTVIVARNVTATGTAVSSWRFTNHAGNIAGEAFDVDPDEDPGYIVWDDSAASIVISGHVYSDEGTATSTVCDGSTNNIRLVVEGLTSYTTSCNGDGLGGGTGLYTISGVAYSPGDSMIVYIDGNARKAATVTEDPVSSISNLDLYENRVIVRHEGADPLSILDMSLWDSSDDADIPFTAVDAVTDTLTLPADRKLIVWTGKTFRPAGNVTLSGGGSGSAYDGTLELYQNAVFDATGSETHSIGGSFISGTGATFDDETSTITFTTSGAARTIDTNDTSFYNLILNGSGSWTVTNTTLDVQNDLTITQGALTLPSATTTITGSFLNNGGSFLQNGGHMYFNSSAAESIRTNGSNFGTTTFNGSGSWAYTDTNATSTGDFLIRAGSVTAPSGILTVGGIFTNSATFTHNNGTLKFISPVASTTITTGSSDLYAATFAGTGSYIFTNGSVALLGSLTIAQGSVTFPTGTISIAGSLSATGGTFNHSSGTVLFNSSDVGETINPGNSSFYVVSIAAPSGGYSITGNATTTSNFSLTSATSFTLQPGLTLSVEGLFTNLVGGSATTWIGSTLFIDSRVPYTINTGVAGGDTYNNIVITGDTALRMWNSNATTTIADTLSSLYSMDHAGVNGELNIYGNYRRSTGGDYWSYATDFDGTSLTGGNQRVVTVRMANNATTTFTGGTLEMIGTALATTTVRNQGSGTYAFQVQGGTLDAQNYALRNMNIDGLSLSGTTTVTSLSSGDLELDVANGSLITLSSTTLNYNASIVISGMRFATTTAITGTNVKLDGTTPSAWTFTSHRGNLAGEAFDIDGATDCGSVRWSDSSCLLTQQSDYRFRSDDGGEGVPDSEWFDTNWSKRKRITITNYDATTYTNAVVEVTIPYDGDMQIDFDDLRFTDASGTTTLDFVRETYTASTEAVLWVEVPTLVASGDTEIYVYYGNGTVENGGVGTTTFIAYDDFEDNNITEYSGDTSKFTTSGSFNYQGSYGLAAGNVNDRTIDGIYRTDMTVAQGETIRFFKYVNTATGGSDETCTLFGVQNPGSNNNNYAVCLEQFGVDRVSISKNVYDNDTNGTVLASTTITYTTGWYEVEVDWGTDNSMYVSVYKNNVLVATTTATDSSYTTGGIGYTFWFQHGGWDLYSARPLLDTQPTTTIGYEQVSGGASWLAARNTKANGIVAGTIIRPRFVVENTGLPVTDQYRLEFAPKGVSPSCESVSGGSYTDVPPQSSCTGSAICMQSSAHFSDHASTTDLLAGSGTFAEGQIVEDPSNTTQSLSIGANKFTEVEYAIVTTIDATDSNYCLRLTDAGVDLDSYVRVAELGLVFAPTVTSLTFNDGLDINPIPGTTTTIYATGTVSDVNGYQDIILATTTMYRSGVTDLCTADANNCYIAGPSQCSFINCAGNSCDVVCSADFYYYADPTDAGTYGGQTWRATLQVIDAGGATASGSAPSIDLTTVRSVDVAEAIDYGSLEVNANTGSYNATTTIQNIGNAALDISLEGTDLTDGATSYIPVTGEHFATSTFDYSACVYCTQLSSTTPVTYEVDLPKPASTTPSITDQLFWGIAIPSGVAGTAHHGENIFYAIGD